MMCSADHYQPEVLIRPVGEGPIICADAANEKSRQLARDVHQGGPEPIPTTADKAVKAVLQRRLLLLCCWGYHLRNLTGEFAVLEYFFF
jgi:hypothetical protein